MRKLLLLLVCAFVSIGTWAQSYYTTLTDTKGSDKVARITLQEGGALADALASIDNLSQYQYIHISSPGTGATQISLTADDITALSNLNAETIEMQKLNVTEAFTFTNNYAKYVILPDDWTKDEVKAAGLALSTSANFDAAISMSAGNASLNVTGGTEPSLVAYVNHPGTLRDALLHNYWDQQDYKTIGESGNCGKLRKLILAGNICAKDISRKGVYDENGHYVITGVPDENSEEFARNTDGGYLYPFSGIDSAPGATDGALSGNYEIHVIDLNDAYVPDDHCMDIVVGYNGTQVSYLRELWMPSDSRFKTVPADYAKINSEVLKQICIPGNIEYIKTRAFASTGGGRFNYIWTTGPDGNTKYDNGAAFVTGDKVDNAVTTVKFMDPNHDEEDEEWQAFNNPTDYNKFQYGTITLPANLKLIERFAFAGCTSVKDVYVLNVHAPECHVDAFSTNQYDANNTVAPGYVKDGIVTRDAYRQGDFKEFKFMTVLHYPKETTDPDIQRYTDPTREYSIATGERDDKGNMIYFPNHSEVSYAYVQGSYGYVWKAWDDSRNWYDQSLKTKLNNFPLDKASRKKKNDPNNPNGEEWGTNYQQAATDLWTANTNAGKADRSFYDVTLGTNNQPGEATAPSGLAPYYNTIYQGHTLYPQPEVVEVTDENGNPVMETVPVRDANGNIIYDGPFDDITYEGNYIKNEVDIYPENENGEYCHSLTRDDGNGTWTIGYTETEDPNGEWVKAPWDATGNTWTEYQDYMASQYPGIKRYNREPSGFVRFVDQYGAPRFNIGDDYVLYSSVTSEYKNLLTRYDKTIGYEYREATSADAGPFYTMETQEVQKQQVTVQNDYRGWHQFVLTAYAANTIVPYEYLRSFITDNDWWTVCEPFDMRYSDMVMFFGTNRRGFETKIPYLSKLTYVIRDVEKGKITLMFSKNLMEYMEYEMVDGEKKPISDGNHKHGWIDEETKWPATKDGIALGEEGYDPIILHAGVPYLIKPNMMFMEGTTQYNRQFSIAKRDNPDLFERLKAAEELPGDVQMDMVYDGEYTVPSYVVGSGAEGALAEGTISAGTKSISNSDGSSFTYKDTDKGGEQITYGGKKVDYKLSSDYTYTFVGTFYRSVMPQYCYFLGWNPELNGGKGGAAFWYSRVQDTTGWNWNNETGIIIPNWDQITSTEVKNIHKATSISDPARWEITNAKGVSALSPDDFPSAGGAKSYGMEFGATNYFQYDEATGISELKELPLVGKLSIYNTNGVYMGSSLKGLAKGVYIVNGQKYVVK